MHEKIQLLQTVVTKVTFGKTIPTLPLPKSEIQIACRLTRNVRVNFTVYM